MREMIRYGLTLAIICVIAAASLAGLNSLTRSRIFAQAQTEEELSLKQVFPEAQKFEPIKTGGETLYYKALDKEGRFAGAVFKASAKGYSSTIEVMAGMAKEGIITAIKVINQNETPGLGAKVAEPDFTGQFSGKNIENLSEVSAITGATISSEAVIDAVDKKAKEIKELIKDAR